MLVGAFKAASTGERRVVLVAGEPGVGKTRLVAALARHADDEGALVLFGRCEEDLAVAYQPFAEALRGAGPTGITTASAAAGDAGGGPALPPLIDGGVAVVFTHDAVVRAAVAWALGTGLDISRHVEVANCSITTVEMVAGVRRLVRTNEKAHLDGLALEG